MYMRKDKGCTATVLAYMPHGLWIEARWSNGRSNQCTNRTVVSVPYFCERYGVDPDKIVIDHAYRRALVQKPLSYDGLRQAA